MSYLRNKAFGIPLIFVVIAACFILSASYAETASPGGQDAVQGQFVVPSYDLPFEPARVQMELRWTQKVQKPPEHPALASIYATSDRLFVQTFDANLLALDAPSGTWKGGVSMDELLSYPPVVSEDRIFVVSSGNLLRLDVSGGDVEISYRLNVVPSAPYILHKGYLIIPTEMGEVVGIKPQTGKQDWSFTPSASVRGALAVDGDTVYAAAYRAGVMAASVNDGTIRWSWSPPQAEISRCHPAAQDGKVYVGDNHGFVHCLDGDIGLPYWRYPVGSPVEACVVLPGDRLLVTTYRGETICLSSSKSSELLWTYPKTAAYVGQGTGKIYLLTDDNALCAVSLEKGEELWRRELPSDMEVIGGPAKGQLYLYTPAGDIIALSEKG